MQKHRHIVLLVLTAFLVVGVAAVGAQEKLYPIGKINLEATSVGVGLGFSWGKGRLHFQGKDYNLKVDGLTIAAVGIAKVTAVGDVYNLKNPADIEGTYTAAGAGIALAGGIKGLVAKNQKGVYIDLVATQKGVSINIGPGGYSIKMQ